MTGAATLLTGAFAVPNVTASGAYTLTLTVATATGNISASSGATVIVTAALTVGNVTNSGSGAVTLTAATTVGSVANTSSGNVNLTAATTIAGIANSGTGIVTSSPVGAVSVTGNVTNTGTQTASTKGQINFASTAGVTIAGVLTNSPTINFPASSTSPTVTNAGIITFAAGPHVITGVVTNSPVITGTTSTGTTQTTTWTNNGSINFASTSQTLTFTGGVVVGANVALTSGNTAAANGNTIVATNNGAVTFAITTGGLLGGGITNSSAWTNISTTGSTLVTQTGNASVILTSRTTGQIGVGVGVTITTAFGPIVSTATGSSSVTNGIIDLGTGGGFYGTSISSSGGAGPVILVGNENVAIGGSITNARTSTGLNPGGHIQIGNAGTAAVSVAIGGNVAVSGASNITFNSYLGTTAGENFSVAGSLNNSGTGTISIPNAIYNAGTPATIAVTLGGINIQSGTINLAGTGVSTRDIVVNGTATFAGGTFSMGTTGTRQLQLGGLNNYFSTGTTKTDFSGTNMTNVTLLFKATTIFGQQIVHGNLTTAVWYGPMTVDNTNNNAIVPGVVFQEGNIRALGNVTFSGSAVNLTNMTLFIGGQVTFLGAGNFVNTSGYTTTGNGFVSMNGNAAQGVSGIGSFGNFEVDAGANTVTIAPLTGPFTATFNLTSGLTTAAASADIVFNGPAPYPTIVRNAGTFGLAPTFTSMVNVYYIGLDKGTALELPVAANKLNNLTVATTNGAASAGKGTVNVAVATTVNGTLNILPNQALVINGVNLTVKGPSIVLGGDLVNEYVVPPALPVGRLILDAPTGTAITGSGTLPDLIVNAGAVATITGPVGMASSLLGADNIRAGLADVLPGTGGSITFLANGVGVTSSLTAAFGTPNATTGVHLSGTILTATRATFALGADLMDGGNLVHPAGTVAIDAYTYTLGGAPNSITEGALVTSTTGKLLFSSALVAPSVSIASSANPFLTPRVFTTVAAHGLAVGQLINISGHSVSGWSNGTYIVGAGSFTPTTFEVTNLAGVVVNGNGGGAGGATGTVQAAPMLTANSTSAAGPAIDAKVEVALASSGSYFYLAGAGPLTISKDFMLTKGIMQLGDATTGTNLILTGSNFTIGSSGSINTIGIGTLQLNATVPPMIMSYTGSPTLGNLRISNDVTLAGTGTGLGVSGTLTHDAGVLDFNSRTLTASGTYVRTAGTYSATTGYFVFSGGAFAKGTTAFSVPNLRLNSAVTVTGAAVLTVTKMLDINFGGTFNHDISGAPTLAVADLVTVTWTSGDFDDPLTYAGTITLIAVNGGALTIPANVWPAAPTTLVTTFQVNGGGTTFLPGNRTVNTALWLTTGTLNLTGPRTLTMVDNSTVYRHDQGAVTLGGGGLVYGINMTVVYQNDGFFGAFPPPYFTTGAELPPTVANLTFTRTANVGNFATLINSNVTVTGLLSIKNDVVDNGVLALAPIATVNVAGNAEIQIDAYANATTPVVNLTNFAFSGTGSQTLTVPSSGAAVMNFMLNQTGTSSTVTVAGGPLTVNGQLSFVNGILVSGTRPIVLGGTVDRTGLTGVSHIYGTVRRNIAVIGRYEYPVGSMTQYRPMSITFTTVIPVAIGLTVQHVDSDPLGRLGLPATDAAAGIRIGGYPPYYWLVMSTTSLGQSIPYDLELVGTSPFGRPFNRADDLRIIHRFDGNDLFNPWAIQGTGAAYSNFLAVRPSGDTVVTVRVRGQLGGIVPEASRYTIGIPTRPPTWTAAPDSIKVNEGVALSTQFTADPQDVGETITYAVVSGPAGLAISATGLVTWTPGYDQAGVKLVQLSAFDGEFTITKNVVITVVNVNRAPVFAPKTASFTKTDKDTLKVALAATDADNDALTYSVGTITPAATNAPAVAGSQLTWKPTFADAGKTYTITAIVSDGVTTGQGPTPGRDTLTVTVVVNRSRALGDADGNGTVQAADASVVLQYVAGLTTVTDPAALWAMDASKNGTITAYDASLILQAAAGLIPPLTGTIEDAGLSKGTAMQATGMLEMASPEATTNPEVVKVGIKLSNPANVYSVALTTKGDFSLVSIDAVNSTLPEGWDMKWNVVGNELRIAAAGTTPLATGDVAAIMVHLKSKESRISFSTDAMLNENFQSLGAVEVAAIPTVYALDQNYPNPFNPSTTIRYQIPTDASVNLIIYNVQGQKIRTLVSKEQKAGYYNVVWDGRNEAGQTVSTGLYLYRVQAGSFVATQKMLMLK